MRAAAHKRNGSRKAVASYARCRELCTMLQCIAGLTDRAQARASASARLGDRLSGVAPPAASAVLSPLLRLRERVARWGIGAMVSGLTGRQSAADARPPPPLERDDASRGTSRTVMSAPPPRRSTAMPASHLGTALANTALVAGATPGAAQGRVEAYARASWRPRPPSKTEAAATAKAQQEVKEPTWI